MTIPSSQASSSAIAPRRRISRAEEIVLKRDREEWDNEGGAARLPVDADADPSNETLYLADILPPPIMANRRKAPLGCAFNG